MSFNPQAGTKGVSEGISSISAGISPLFGDAEQFIKGNSILLLGASILGFMLSFFSVKHGKLHDLMFFGSAGLGAAGLYGHLLKGGGTSGYAHSYYAPGMPGGPYYQPYMYNSPPPMPIYGAPPPYIQGPPNVHYIYQQPPSPHHPSIFELIFGKKKHKKKKKHYHPFYPMYAQPLNSFYSEDADVMIPREIVTGQSINGTRNIIDDSNHVFSNISDMY